MQVDNQQRTTNASGVSPAFISDMTLAEILFTAYHYNAPYNDHMQYV
jgi:hypothetical protein